MPDKRNFSLESLERRELFSVNPLTAGAQEPEPSPPGDCSQVFGAITAEDDWEAPVAVAALCDNVVDQRLEGAGGLIGTFQYDDAGNMIAVRLQVILADSFESGDVSRLQSCELTVQAIDRLMDIPEYLDLFDGNVAADFDAATIQDAFDDVADPEAIIGVLISLRSSGVEGNHNELATTNNDGPVAECVEIVVQRVAQQGNLIFDFATFAY